MKRNRGFIHFFVIAVVVIAIFLYIIAPKDTLNDFKNNLFQKALESTLPTLTPYQFPYKVPQIPKNQSYRIIIVGDSIVASLGPNANTLRLDLIKRYPDNEFVTYNYGYPATNILTLPLRLTEVTSNGLSENPPILKQGFELLILESFGYNPLSEFTLSEGLQKQTEILEQSVGLILKEKPNAALLFMTPIALSNDFAKGTYDLSPLQRKSWVEERNAYIENHIKFAKEKGIPIIDVYKASLKPDGSVDKTYISKDFIHPSQKGVDLISQTISDYIFENKIFPQ